MPRKAKRDNLQYGMDDRIVTDPLIIESLTEMHDLNAKRLEMSAEIKKRKGFIIEGIRKIWTIGDEALTAGTYHCGPYLVVVSEEEAKAGGTQIRMPRPSSSPAAAPQGNIFDTTTRTAEPVKTLPAPALP